MTDFQGMQLVLQLKAATYINLINTLWFCLFLIFFGLSLEYIIRGKKVKMKIRRQLEEALRRQHLKDKRELFNTIATIHGRLRRLFAAEKIALDCMMNTSQVVIYIKDHPDCAVAWVQYRPTRTSREISVYFTSFPVFFCEKNDVVGVVALIKKRLHLDVPKK